MNELLELNIQMFSDGKIVISTELDTKNFQRGLNTMQNKAKSGGSAIKNIVAGLGITKMIGMAFSTITSSIDGAVKRMDTLNMFPKVMSNLGVSSKDAEQAIAKMSEKLRGLPTTLDAGASAVQRFTSKNGDVKKSTDLFLALNNAILAGGAPTEQQAAAMEQLSQSYAKGKPDMMEWRTAMSAMPAQLKQVAIAMGYIDADQLGEALRKGEVSMDDFMDTIVELNEKGVKGFQSFEQQARNSTGGLQTSIENAKNAVTRGVEGIIRVLDTSFEGTKFGNLGGFIGELGVKVEQALGELGNLVSGKITAFDFGAEIGDLINRTIVTIYQNFPKYFEAGVQTLLELVKGFASKFPEMVKNTIALINTIADTIIDNLDEIIDAAIEIIFAIADGIIDNLPKIVDSAVRIILALVNKLTEPATIDKLVQAAGKLIAAIVLGLIRALPNIVVGMAKVGSTIVNSLLSLPGKMIQIGIDIVKGIWKGVKQRAGQLGKDLEKWADEMVEKVKKKLKIKSPSRVFRDEVGKNMAAGIGVGFKEGMEGVYKDMQEAVDLETSKMTANVQTNGTYKMAMADIPTFNLLDNSTNQTQLVVNGRVLAEVVNTENKNREVAKA